MQNSRQIARGAKLAQQRHALLMSGLRLRVLPLTARQITKCVQYMRDPKGIACFTGLRETFLQQGPSGIVAPQLNR